MQTMEVISVNLWQMLVSLANLGILFFILKRLLYTPVLRVLEERRSIVEGRYVAAEEAKRDALAAKTKYETRLSEAQAEADKLRQDASEEANRHSAHILMEAREKADGMVRQAEEQIAMEHMRAASDIKREIAEASTKLAEKLIEREMDERTHRKLVASFIDEIGDEL